MRVVRVGVVWAPWAALGLGGATCAALAAWAATRTASPHSTAPPAPQAPPDPSPGPPRDGWIVGRVVNDEGPVSGADVRLTSVTPAPCPCPERPDWPQVGDMPRCACPEAFAGWKARLAACTWPAPTTGVARSGDGGWFELRRSDSANTLEAAGPNGLTWIAAPARGSLDVALELQPTVTPALTIVLPDGRPAADVPGLRGAFLFEDGHCVPLVRAAATWRSAAPLPASLDDGGAVVMVDAPGWTPVVQDWDGPSDEPLRLVLQPFTQISGLCNRTYGIDDRGPFFAGATLRYEGLTQRITTRTDRRGRFWLGPIPRIPAFITCERTGTVLARWIFLPAGLWDSLDTDWLEPQNLPETDDDELADDDPGWAPGDREARCAVVAVVDHEGHPVPDVDLAFWFGDRQFDADGGWTTNERGRVCAEELLERGRLLVRPPCGETLWVDHPAWTPRSGRPPRSRVELPARPPPGPRADVRGRILSPERYPIADAAISWGEVEDADAEDATCDVEEAEHRSAADGTFVLRGIPHGRAILHVQHPWYADRDVEVSVPGPSPEIVVGRGATWRGRVLAPNGAIIDRCDVAVARPGGGVVSFSRCSTSGFVLRTLPPGEAQLVLSIEGDPALGARAATRSVRIVADEDRREDLRWPSGVGGALAAIAGDVVTASGQPVPHARIIAIPEGALDDPNRLDQDEIMVDADAGGHFVLRHLPRIGTWLLRGGGRGGPWAATRVTAGTRSARLVVSAASP